MSLTLAGIPLAVAILPLGFYLLLLGWLHLRRRPVVVSGVLDLVLLAAGVSGLVLVGPLALVQPVVGTTPWATAILVLVFMLAVGVAVLATRPRLIIYNMTVDQLRPVVAEVVSGLDPSARWAGESVALPARGLKVLMDSRGLTRCVSMVAIGSRTSAEAWSEFARRLRRGVGPVRVRRNPWGAVAVLLGIAIMLFGSAWSLAERFADAAVRITDHPRQLSMPVVSAVIKSTRPATHPRPVSLSIPRQVSPCQSTSTSPPTRSPFQLS